MRRVAVLAGLAIAGCGGGATTPSPPLDGLARYDARGVVFDRPAGWTLEEPVPGLVSYYGAPGEGGLPPQVGLGVAPARNAFAASVAYHKDQQRIRFRDYDVTADRPMDVAGAVAAHLVDARYTMAKPGSSVRVREVNLLVMTGDGRQLDFFVRAPAGDYAAAGLDAVFDSFRLR